VQLERVLVTGCWGFVGRNLISKLAAEGFEVWGVDKSSTDEQFAGKDFVSLDLTDGDKVRALIGKIKPAYIVHLAAQSSAGRSIDNPLATIITNLLPTLHILDTVRLAPGKTRLLAVGSADEYGQVEAVHLPLMEARQTQPCNPYGLSKVLQSQCCSAYASLYGVDVVITRSFNHTGPWQTDTFVLPSFAKQIVEIKYGLRDPEIEVGDIEVKRDFLDVRDVVEAYISLLYKGKTGEVYNVCSGKAYSLRELLNRMCKIAGIDLSIRVREERTRRVDPRELRGNKLKITRDTGWSPKIPIEETLRSLLVFWERVIMSSKGAT
jgi:GDP-4-dehydro-6-deoxy-D-mannose reductase